MNSAFVESGRKYVKAGFSIFPVNGNGSKVPLISEDEGGWKPYQTRLPTDEELVKWGEKYPTAGMGMACGPVSNNLVVFDIDVDYPGLIERIAPDIEKAPTYVVKTPSGGFHFYFREKAGARNRVFMYNGKHVGDLRGSGGYVAVPPTAGYAAASAEKKILEVDSVLTWVIDFLKRYDVDITQVAQQKKSVWENAKERLIGEGERDDTVFRYACHMFKDGFSPEGVLQATMVFNLTYCVPPLDLEYIKKKVHSASQYRQEENEKYTSVPIKTIEPRMPPDLVGQFVPQNLVTVLYGEFGQGKTYVTLHLAMCLALGEPFLGCGVQQRNVLFLDWENNEGASSYVIHKISKGMEQDKPPINFFYSRAKFPITEIADLIEEDVMKKNIGVVVIDSFGRMSSGRGVKSDQKDESTIISLISRLEKFGTTVIIIDHVSKNKETGLIQLPYGKSVPMPFGSVFKGAMARSMIYVERDFNDEGILGVTLYQTKSNYSWLKSPLPLTILFEKDRIRFGIREKEKDASDKLE